jgi:hypothetical protein
MQLHLLIFLHDLNHDDLRLIVGIFSHEVASKKSFKKRKLKKGAG